MSDFVCDSIDSVELVQMNGYIPWDVLKLVNEEDIEEVSEYEEELE